MLRPGRHLAICSILMLGPSLWLAPPPFWSLDPRLWIVLAGGVAAYLLAILPSRGSAGDARFTGTMLRYGAWSALWILGIILWEAGPLGAALPMYSRPAILASLATGLIGLLLTTQTQPKSWSAIAAIVLAGLVCLAGQAAFYKQLLPRPTGPEQRIAVLDTALYQIRLTSYLNAIPGHRDGDPEARWGGGVAPWGADYLLATGEGTLFVFNEDRPGKMLRIRKLPYQAPMNFEEFERGAAEVFRDAPGTYVETNRFRLAGVLVQDSGDMRRLLVTHHIWDVANHCYRLRLSTLEGTACAIRSGACTAQVENRLRNFAVPEPEHVQPTHLAL